MRLLLCNKYQILDQSELEAFVDKKVNDDL